MMATDYRVQLRKRIKNLALTLDEVCVILGLAKPTVHNLINGVAPTRLKHIQKLPKRKFDLTTTRSVGEFLKRLRLMSGKGVMDYARSFDMGTKRYGALELGNRKMRESDLRLILGNRLVPDYAKGHLGKLYLKEIGIEIDGTKEYV